MNSRAVRRVLSGRTTVLGAGLLIGLSLGLAGCSGTSRPSSAAAAAASAGPAVVAVATKDGKVLPKGLTSAARTIKITPVAICGVVDALQPSLDAANSVGAAKLTLQTQISTYFDQVNAKPRLTGAVIDKDLKKSCPAVRKAALKATGKKSFNAIL